MNNAAALAAQITKVEEGFSATPYYCTEKYPTVGFGVRLGDKDTPLYHYDIAVTKRTARTWLEDILELRQDNVKSNNALCVAYSVCDDLRKAVLLSMIYQMGMTGVSKFKKTIDHLEHGDYERASNEMLDSKWAKEQTPERAQRHAHMIRYGKLLDYYL